MTRRKPVPGQVCNHPQGPLTERDRDAIARFAEFLTDVGPVDGPPRPAALLKHADYLGLDEETRARCRAALDATP